MANEKKKKFIEEIEKAFNEIEEFTLSEDALVYFEAMKIDEAASADKKFTDNGKIVLAYFQEHYEEHGNLMRAKDFEDGGVSARTASGAMRKLIADGYVEKIGDKPVTYSLTTLGKEAVIED